MTAIAACKTPSRAAPLRTDWKQIWHAPASPPRIGRCSGEARLSRDDALLAATVGAQLMVRVKARAIFRNCPLYSNAATGRGIALQSQARRRCPRTRLERLRRLQGCRASAPAYGQELTGPAFRLIRMAFLLAGSSPQCRNALKKRHTGAVCRPQRRLHSRTAACAWARVCPRPASWR